MQIQLTVSHRAFKLLIFNMFLGLFLLPCMSPAQTRINDRDLATMMRNLRDDAKSFHPHFDAAVHKSTIRKTSQAKNARSQAANFTRQTEALLNRFKKDHNGVDEFTAVMNSAQQLDAVVNLIAPGPQVTAQWQKIRTEIHLIAKAYGVPEHFQSSSMSPTDGIGSGSSISCLQSAGAVKANQLVNECLQVSPATHPPCNAQNSCALIISEIKRSCALIGSSAPDFCTNYQ